MFKNRSFQVLIVIGLLVVGFIYLLRGCLATYDERTAISRPVYFEKNQQTIVLSLVKYFKTNYYSSGGGMTRKSGSTTYYLQTNDASTGKKIMIKEIKGHSDIKNYPVKMMGKVGQLAWFFVNEPMAFNAFTLEKFADKKIIEEKNPVLRGKMPDQEQYYQFNSLSQTLQVTLTDGSKYSIDANNLNATVLDEEADLKLTQAKALKALEAQETYYGDLARENYNNIRSYDRLYNNRQMKQAAYQDSLRNFEKRNNQYRAIADSIRMVKRNIEERANQSNEQMEALKDLQEDTHLSYTNTIVDVDTFQGSWYGLKTTAALEKIDDRFRYNHVYGETDRNKLYSAPYTIENNPSKFKIGTTLALSERVYLQGGFLLNKETAIPIHLTAPGFIICFKEKIGNEGNCMLASVNLQGQEKWSVNCGFKEINDWIYTGQYLIVYGTDNKELSSGENNVMLSIDIKSGKQVTYDFFTDKIRKQ